MRAILSAIVTTMLVVPACADSSEEGKAVRVIPITRENAEASAAAIAAARSPLIGMPPAGKAVRAAVAESRPAKAVSSAARDSFAETRGLRTGQPADASHRQQSRRVEIIRPGAGGAFVSQVYYVR